MKSLVLAAGLLLAIAIATTSAQNPAAPTFTPAGELVLPSDYREWVFVGTGLGMTYGPNKRSASDHLMFDNIYVTRDAYRGFLQSGK